MKIRKFTQLENEFLSLGLATQYSFNTAEVFTVNRDHRGGKEKLQKIKIK